MVNFYRAEQLTEQSTTSDTFVDVSGASVTFTPESTSEIWLVFATGVVRSNSTEELSGECRLVVNGTERDVWGHQNNTAGTPNGAGFLIFDRITGTVASQTVKVQFRDAALDNTSYIDDVRVVVARLPANADFQWQASDSSVQTTGANVTVETLTFTPSSAADYYVFGKMSHRETPGGSTSQAWVEDQGDATPLHPNAPDGTRHSNARAAWNPMSVVFKTAMGSGEQNVFLKFTSTGEGAGSSEHQYRRIMAFRADAWDQDNYSESAAQSTTTSTSFQTKNSLAVAAPPQAQDYLVIQCARISGDNSSTAQKAGELRTGAVAKVRTNHHINRDNSATQGYHHTIGYVDAVNEDSAVTYYNGFLSPNAITVACAESAIAVLRYPAPAVEGNAPFFGMVA